jgi:AraC-like DNA-binding protein
LDINIIVDALLAKLPSVEYDERVIKIVEYIKANYSKQNITPQTFSDLVFLSPSRLASLFKQQTGSSVSKYLLWTRLRQAIYLTLSDKDRSLTDIAYETGFYDLPQFNKYMYEMFGMPPKALKFNSDLIEIY